MRGAGDATPAASIGTARMAACVAWTMPTVFLRPSFFMQNLSTTHRDEIREGRLVVPAGHGHTAFVDVRDVAGVAAKVLLEDGHEGRAYELTGREALDYARVAAVLSDVLGRRIVYADPSPVAFWRHARAAGRPVPYVLVMLALYFVARFGVAAQVAPDLERLLGRPPIDVRTFAQDHAEVWRA
jgi:uncharacterized protein YbjT (DUF2867 family)